MSSLIKMGDWMLYAALAVSVLGLFILAYVSSVLVPPVSRVGDIGSDCVGKQVHLRGNVSGYRLFSGGSSVFTLSDGSGNISVYLQYSISKALPEIADAHSVDVVGEVDEYRGSLEVVPKNRESVRVLS